MNKTYILLTAAVLSACGGDSGSRATARQDSKQALSCSIPSDSLMGKAYLDSKFLAAVDAIPTDEAQSQSTEGMVYIPGAEYEMGGDVPEGFEEVEPTARPQPDEYPKHPVRVSDFYMDEHEVTVREFREFVDATGYITVAERDVDWEELRKQMPEGTPKLPDSMLRAGALVFHFLPAGVPREGLHQWWKYTPGAHWKNPDGKNRPLEEILDLPVTQISWYDAMAYAKWRGKRLPTEAEYEYAMRAGLQNKMYPWGNDRVTQNNKAGNFLQGDFPYNNTGEDGYTKVAPVQSFAPNAYGLYDIAGNVWEWTLDWYGANYYQTCLQEGRVIDNPMGPQKTLEVYNPNAVNKVVRGGSFLCNDSWCSGYRNARRMRLSPDTGMEHLGFRCVKDVKK